MENLKFYLLRSSFENLPIIPTHLTINRCGFRSTFHIEKHYMVIFLQIMWKTMLSKVSILSGEGLSTYES